MREEFKARWGSIPQRTLIESCMLTLNDWQGIWTASLTAGKTGSATRNLLETLKRDPEAFNFIRSTFETLALPRDSFSRSVELRQLVKQMPDALPASSRIALQAGGAASAALPWAVIPVIKARFRSLLEDLVTAATLPDDASPSAETADAVRVFRGTGIRPNIEFWGSEATGSKTALQKAKQLVSIISSGAAGAVTVDVSLLLPVRKALVVDSIVADPPEAIRTVFDAATKYGVVLNLTASNYSDSLLLPGLIKTLLTFEEYKKTRAGVHVYAELPEAAGIAADLADFGKQRVDAGGEALVLTVSMRSFGPLERVRSFESGLPVPVFEDKTQKEAQAFRVLETLLSGGSAGAVRVFFESSDPVLIALARVIARLKTVEEVFEIQLRKGVAPEMFEILKNQGELSLSVPVISKDEFSHALPNLLEIFADFFAEENSEEALFNADAATQVRAREGERARIESVLAESAKPAPAPHRMQDRALEWDYESPNPAQFYKPPTEAFEFGTGGLTTAVLALGKDAATGKVKLRETTAPKRIPAVSSTGFANEVATDFTRSANRRWFANIMSAEGFKETEDSVDLLNILETEAATEWKSLSEKGRASALRRVALAMASARDLFVQALRADLILPAEQIDFEVNAMIDAARYYANRVDALRAVRGASFEPENEILVVVDADASFAEFVESVTAVLASGAAAVCVIPNNFSRTFKILEDEWKEAGIPDQAVRTRVFKNHKKLGKRLSRELQNDNLNRAILIADPEVSDFVRRVRPDILRDERRAGVGTAIVTGYSEPEKALNDVFVSAFNLSNKHPVRVQALILTGEVGEAKTFFERLIDRVGSLKLQNENLRPDEALHADLAPLYAPATKLQRRALTELAPGESWLVVPRQLDDTGRAWSPGIRLGVKPDAWFWRAAKGLPLLGVVETSDLPHATEAERVIGGGSVAMLQSLNEKEIIYWLHASDAATLVVNKPTNAAKIERLPFGVRGTSSNYPQTLAGGPTRLGSLGTWRLREGSSSETLHLRGLKSEVVAAIETSQAGLSYEAFDRTRRAALADVLAWKTQLGIMRDFTALPTEHNILRYKPVAVQIRADDSAMFESFVRVLVAALTVGAPFSVSTAKPLPPDVARFLEVQGVTVFSESDDDWLERMVVVGANAGGVDDVPVERVRYIGDRGTKVSEWMSSHPGIGVLTGPVTIAGTVELLGFLREQAISVSRSRHGFAVEHPRLGEWIANNGRI